MVAGQVVVAADQPNVAPHVAPDVAAVRPPSWGVVALCVAVAAWVAVMSLTVVAVSWPRRVAPRRVVPRLAVRRRARYVGAHGKRRAAA